MKIKVTKSKTLQSWLLTQISIFLDASASLAPAPVSSLVSRLVYILYIIQGRCLTSKVGWYTYCVRAERIVFWWPNTNTNIIRLPKNDRIRIRILFGFPKRTEYEYEYYSASKNYRIRIRILFGFPKMTEYEYEYYSAAQKGPNTNTNIIRLHQKGQNTNIIRIPKNT